MKSTETIIWMLKHYELDVVKQDGPLDLIDEDEFAEAVAPHGCSTVPQQQCYAAAAKTAARLDRWQVGLPPVQTLRQQPTENRQ